MKATIRQASNIVTEHSVENITGLFHEHLLTLTWTCPLVREQIGNIDMLKEEYEEEKKEAER